MKEIKGRNLVSEGLFALSSYIVILNQATTNICLGEETFRFDNQLNLVPKHLNLKVKTVHSLTIHNEIFHNTMNLYIST